MDLYFSREVDYMVTGNAAYAAFELFGDNFDNVLQYVNISKRYISIALEPGKKDINYFVWNNAVLMVLWQILFIKDYKMIVDDKLNDKKTLNGYDELLFELEKIKSQFNEWHDCCGLFEVLFGE